MNSVELISALTTSLTYPDLLFIVDKDIAVVAIPASKVADLATELKTRPEFAFDMLTDLTAVDWLGKQTPRFEVVYHFYSTSHNHRLRVKAAVDEGQPVPSLTKLYSIANWFEREVWDLYGIKFARHPNLKRILLYEEFKGHPLRKDYPYDKRQPLEPETWPVRELQVQMEEGRKIHRP
ncbi:MAG: NADH-quinone oxidoreductase subunit C [Calditrichaeota bacterium]|nr:NADH-quinone oxidoreductase subunit C [Calditrichota bacterium]